MTFGSIFILAATAFNPLTEQPFTFAGRITDFAHVGYDADQKVEIRAKTQDGKLIAKTTTATGGNTAYNYVLYIPVSTSEAEGHVTAGTPLVFEFVDPDGTVYTGLVTGADAVVGASGDIRKLNLALASDEDGDGIPDEYVESLAYLMWINGKTSYDPGADWDGDGVSNRDEYVAGTNPFDATDKLSILKMAVEAGFEDYYKLKFLVNPGRSYSAETAFGLKSAEWRQASFVDAGDGDEKERINTAENEIGYREIFVLKESVMQQFWRLKVE